MKTTASYFQSHPFAKTTAILTLFLLLFLVLMNFCFPSHGANGFSSFIIAFEFAKSPSDIHTLFQGMSPAEIKKVDIGNYFDFGFMITYSLFITMLYTTAAKVFKKRWLLIGIALAAIAFIFDFTENLTLFEITKNYTGMANEADLIVLLKKLHVVTWIKWVGLAFSFLMFSGILFTQKWFCFILGAICVLPLFYIIILSAPTPQELSLFTNLIFLSFFVLIIFSFFFKNEEL